MGVDKDWRRHMNPYYLYLLILALFVVTAFVADSPAVIASGLYKIFTTPSPLLTDFIAVGGVGAALINSVITALFGIGLLLTNNVTPNGATIMAISLNIGFSFIGKTVVSMLPIILGVWLYARYQKEAFSHYSLVALLSATLSPVVSEFHYNSQRHPSISFWGGILLGVLVGFFIPIISSTTNRVHGGYTLYNIGFAGGIITLFLVALRKSIGDTIETVMVVSRGNNLMLAVLIYSIMLLWAAYSISKMGVHKVIPSQKSIMKHSGRLVTDYYLLYGEGAFFNMGIMGALGVTLVLLLGGDLNGLTMAGVFAMMGFGAFGKHLRNCLPVIAGAILFAYINLPAPTDPVNMAAILFCTGLAPISGQYGWFWGVLAGLMQCGIVSHVGLLSSGLNLYNNGFASGFVALVLVPVILAIRRGKKRI